MTDITDTELAQMESDIAGCDAPDAIKGHGLRLVAALRSERAASADCMWCGQTGRLATFTMHGDEDEATPCICVLRAELQRERTQNLRLSAALVHCEAALTTLTEDHGREDTEYCSPCFARDRARAALSTQEAPSPVVEEQT